ncbi:MAG: LacI family DNA-binding transcriptional regulator [Verrucomicrobiota bacterium]|nr:LacI family DNA-binding transcriptional regulator [Verrucomicrobiota bacterium]
MPIRPTLQDVAREAGVSKATACKALNRYSDVRESTRQAVLDAVSKLHYIPDQTLSEIAVARWRKLPTQTGTVVGWLQNNPLSEYRTYRESAIKRALELGMRVEVFIQDDYPSIPRLTQVLTSRGIRGLLVGPQFHPDLLDTFDWSQFAAVSCNRGRFELPIPAVIPDYFQSIMLCVERMKARGYRRLGAALCQHDPVHIDDHCRHAAWNYASALYGFDNIPLWSGPFDAADGFIQWVKEYKPDGILGIHSGMVWWLINAGYAVPGKIAFATLHQDFNQDDGTAGCDNRMAHLGRKAVDQVALMLRTREVGLSQPRFTVTVAPAWVDGPTLPSIRY